MWNEELHALFVRSGYLESCKLAFGVGAAEFLGWADIELIGEVRLRLCRDAVVSIAFNKSSEHVCLPRTIFLS